MAVSRRSKVIAAGLAALALALALRWLDPQVLQIARFLVFDQYQQLAPRNYAPAPVRVIAIDEESLRRFGQWPWPRHYMAQLVRNLASMGAAAIAFDIVFAEPDRTSPGRLLRAWNLPHSERERLSPLLASLIDHDQALAEALAETPSVLGMIFQSGPAEPLLLPRKTGFGAHEDVMRAIPTFDRATRNLPMLEKVALGFANFSYLPERDGIVRRVPLLASVQGTVIPTIAVEALRVAQGASTIVARGAMAEGEFRLGAAYGLHLLRVGQFEIPMAADTRFWVHYTTPQPERTIPAWKVLRNMEEVRERIEGQIMLVGATAPGLRDLRATPLAGGVPGIYIHAQALEQIIAGHFLLRPEWADAVEFAGLALVGLAFVILLPLLGPIPCAAIGLVAAASGAVGSWAAYLEARLLIDPVYPAISAFFVYLVVTSTQYLLSERERRRVRSTFGRYLSPALVTRMAESGREPELGGEERELTLMFCDIRGFTAISERLTPIQLTHFINQFLTPMTDIVLATGGTIDKYMGDAIMAFWNAPVDEPDHAARAVTAALDMRLRLAELAPQWRVEAEATGSNLPAIRIGIGINTGLCVVGNMGSDQRFDYSCLGDTVNAASRLEGQSKTYGVDLVVGEDTVAQAPDFAYLELDLIKVKGKTTAIRVFTVLGGVDVARTREYQALTQQHEALLNAYRQQNWVEAASLAAAPPMVVGSLPGGLVGLYKEYAARVRELSANSPGDDWDGVYEAQTK